MSNSPELLNTTSLVPVALFPQGLHAIVEAIKNCVEHGEVEKAIELASWYCVDSQASPNSIKRRRYVLKILWYSLDELFTKRLEAQILDQVRFPGGFMEADAKAYDAVQTELLNDMRESHQFSRRLGQCEDLVMMMLENESYFTAEGFRLLASKLSQYEDGA